MTSAGENAGSWWEVEICQADGEWHGVSVVHGVRSQFDTEDDALAFINRRKRTHKLLVEGAQWRTVEVVRTVGREVAP